MHVSIILQKILFTTKKKQLGQAGEGTLKKNGEKNEIYVGHVRGLQKNGISTCVCTVKTQKHKDTLRDGNGCQIC